MTACRRQLSAAAWLLAVWTAAAPAAPQVALPYAAAVAARFPDPAEPYDTPGLQPGRDAFTSNAELASALQALAAAPGGPQRIAAGRSASGDDLPALHFSRGPGRPAVLLIGQQHGDEPAGAEALLVLARQLAAGALDDVLERLDVVLLPRANPDGAALAQRRGLHGLDINRDHLLLRTPEAQAVASLVAAFQPLLVVDLHEHNALGPHGSFADRFGGVQRHDLLLQSALTPNMPPVLQRAGDALLRRPLQQALAAAGLRSDWYHMPAAAGADLRLIMGGLQPDTARNLQGLRNGFGVLLESRGGGIGRLHIQRRVHSHVVAVHSLLHSAALHAAELQALRSEAGDAVRASACRGDAVVLAAQVPVRRELLVLDPVTGGDKPVQVAWLSSLALRPLLTRPRPCGYWLGADAEVAVAALQALGVTVRRLDAAALLQREAWRALPLAADLPIDPAFDARTGDTPDSTRSLQDAPWLPIDAPRLVHVALAPLPALEPVPAGSWYVPLDQPLANIAIAVLEPDAPGSWYAQRLLPELGSAARVLAAPGF